MSAAARSIQTDQAVIAVDQDPLGVQGYPVAAANGLWVLSKPLADGGRAVVLFNATPWRSTITTTGRQAGFAHAGYFRVSDLWTGTTTFTYGAIRELVPPHGAVMVRIEVATAPPLVRRPPVTYS
jgi:alpha-galactosidase